MLVNIFKHKQNIANIDGNKTKILENKIYATLECLSFIFQTKQHACVFKFTFYHLHAKVPGD